MHNHAFEQVVIVNTNLLKAKYFENINSFLIFAYFQAHFPN